MEILEWKNSPERLHSRMQMNLNCASQQNKAEIKMDHGTKCKIS